jgi:hypothetical protein
MEVYDIERKEKHMTAINIAKSKRLARKILLTCVYRFE